MTLKFTIWFLCVVFPTMVFLCSFHMAAAAICTMFLYEIVTGIRWLFAKAQNARMKRFVESRVTKLT
jgi:hypothetical protein